jgi:hypothetical protein
LTEDTVVTLRQPGEFEDLLTDVFRQDARKLLAQAVEAEVADCLAKDRDTLLAFYDFPAEHSHDRSQCFFRVELTGGICRARRFADVQGGRWN